MTRVLLGCLALVAVYFALPLDRSAQLGVRLTLTLAGLVLAAWLIWRQMRREFALLSLLFAMVGGVLMFAVADYLIATSLPGQFVDLNTRIDALYFVVSTLGTVGFGDVHAKGQLARAVLCVQMVFNLAVLATAGSILLKRVERKRSRVSSFPDDRAG